MVPLQKKSVSQNWTCKAAEYSDDSISGVESASFQKTSLAKDTPAGQLSESAKSLERNADKDNVLWHLSSTFGHGQRKSRQEADHLHRNEKHLSDGFAQSTGMSTSKQQLVKRYRTSTVQPLAALH